MKPRLRAPCVGLWLAVAAPQALADEAPVSFGTELDVTLAVGAMRGRAREFVFDPEAGGARVSRLDWDLDNVAMMRAALRYRPRPWLVLHLSGGTNRGNRADMNDYDFDVEGCPPAAGGTRLCVSTQPRSELTRAFEFDAGVELRLLHHRLGDVSALLDYAWQTYEFRSYGGEANYLGALPPGAGISYEQTWHTPTLGLRWAREFGALDVSLDARGSAWGRGRDRDHHHLRALLFTDEVRDVDMFMLGAELAYRWREDVRLFLRYDFQRWLLARGDLHLLDLGTGDAENFAAAGGMSFYSQSLTLGIDIRLDGAPRDATAPTDAWQGGYGGLTFGPYWRRASWHTRALGLPALPLVRASRDAEFNSHAAHGGLFIGRGLRYRAWLLGVEADVGRVDADDYDSGIPASAPAHVLRGSPDVVVSATRWDASLRGRIGRNLGADTLAYVTLGLALQHERQRVSCLLEGSWCLADREAKFTSNLFGWTVGAGLERSLAHGWFARAEYRYTDIGDFDHEFFSATPADRIAARLAAASHRLSFGLGWRF